MSGKRLNYGARHAKAYNYDRTAALASVRAENSLSAKDWALLERHSGNALERATSPRFNPSDGIDLMALRRLDTAVCDRAPARAMRAAVDVLEGRMHPTARSVVGGHVRQCIYTLTGHTRKAHHFEVK